MTPLIIEDQFGILQNLQTSPIPKTSFLVGTFFAVSYSKKTLVLSVLFIHLYLQNLKVLLGVIMVLEGEVAVLAQINVLRVKGIVMTMLIALEISSVEKIIATQN